MKQDKILKILKGTIFAQSQIEDWDTKPQFSKVIYPWPCYLVEYDNVKWCWKFFWRQGNEYGIFITKMMTETLPRIGNRYFSDCDKDQSNYSSIISLSSEIQQDGEQSLIYRQDFGNWIGAYM